MDHFPPSAQNDHSSLDRYTLDQFVPSLARPSTSTPLPHGGRPLPVEPRHFLNQTPAVPHGIHAAARRSEQKKSADRPPKSAVPLAEVLNNEEGCTVFSGSLHDLLDDTSARKRRKLDGAELLTLPKPQPPPKNGSRRPRIPPLLQGLHQPPPDAGLFPPISSEPPVKKGQDLSSPDVSASLKLSAKAAAIVQDTEARPQQPSEPDGKKVAKGKKRRRWTEQETRDLLCGVAKFGIGSWKKILTHPEYSFKDRSAVDLKDRFRVCRPDDYRKLNSVDGAKAASPDVAPAINAATHQTPVKPVSSLIASNILQSREPEASPAKPEVSLPDRKHRKGPEDLLRLGIDEPFRKSSHRERRPFTEEEDAALLRGYEKYGPHWKAIRDDPELGLSSRKHPLDLRDRFRNRFPEKYTEAGYKLRQKIIAKQDTMTDAATGANPAAGTKGPPAPGPDQPQATTSVAPASVETTISSTKIVSNAKPFAFWPTFLSENNDFPDFLSEPNTTDTSSPVILGRDILDFVSMDQNLPPPSALFAAMEPTHINPGLLDTLQPPSKTLGGGLTGAFGTLPQLPMGLPSLVRPPGPGPGGLGPGPPLASLLHAGSARGGVQPVSLPPLADLGSGVDKQPSGLFLEELPALRTD